MILSHCLIETNIFDTVKQTITLKGMVTITRTCVALVNTKAPGIGSDCVYPGITGKQMLHISPNVSIHNTRSYHLYHAHCSLLMI